MKYIIEVGNRKQSFFPARVFKPGWYGTHPYFELAPYAVDGLGTEHVKLIIRNAVDSSINGDIIGFAHIPKEYTLIKKADLNKLKDKK